VRLHITGWLAILAVVSIPLYVSPLGNDSFRLPKLLLFTAFGLAIFTMLTIRWIHGQPPPISRPLGLFLGCVGSVFILSTAFSTHPISSLRSSLTMVSCVAVGLAAVEIAKRGADHRVLWYVIVPSVVNGLMVIFQFLEIWNPFLKHATDENQLHLLRRTALQGNTNDLAGLLVLPILVSLFFMRSEKPNTRALAAIASTVMFAAFAIASSMTASFALVVSAVVLFSALSRRALLSTLVVLLLVATIGSSILPVRDRVVRLKTQMTQGGVDGLLSGRLIAFDAAFIAFRDHPFTGIGPGRFGGEFFRYRKAAISRFGETRYYEPSLTRNYSEVHNDYLQLLAESGVAGLTLFVLFMLFVARRSVIGKFKPDSDRALILGVPSVVSLAALSLAHFPLQLPSNLVTYSFTFGLILGWSERIQD
jgi:O-antigen ligase